MQFHKWAAELEAACASETEDKYKRYADLLTAHLRTAEGILAKVGPCARPWLGLLRLPSACMLTGHTGHSSTTADRQFCQLPEVVLAQASVHAHAHGWLQVDSTLELMDALQAQQRDVAQRSRSLHGSCEQLVRRTAPQPQPACPLRDVYR